MTIQIDMPELATDRAIAEIQAHSAKMLSLINATKRDFGIPQGLAQQLRLPSLTIPQGLADSIWSAKSLAESIARHTQPALELSNQFQETVRQTRAMAKRFEAITAPILVNQRRLEHSIAESVKSIRSATIAAQLSLPRPQVGFGGGPFVPNAPVVRVASKAARIIECALQRLRERRRRDNDIRHRVELIVSLPNGEFLQASKLSATEDGIIRVVGVDIEGFLRECFISPEVIQYEIVTVRLPPPGAQMTVVK